MATATETAAAADDFCDVINDVHLDEEGHVFDPREKDEFSEAIKNSRDIIVLNVGGQYPFFGVILSFTHIRAYFRKKGNV